jgi:hypothetical protein
MYTYSRVPQNLGQRESQAPLSCRPGGHPRTGNTGIRAWQRAEKACQDQKAGNLGLAEGWKGAPGPKSRESGLGRGLERRPRSEKPGIWAWQGAGRASQDRKCGNTGLAGGRNGTPGPESREYGLGRGLEGRARTGIAAIWAWVGAKKPSQDQNHRKLVLAVAGCDRNNSDLQNAGTLIQLPGLYRAYERERSVKIFTFFSLRSVSQATLHRNAVPGFCKSRRTCADSTEKYSAKTEKPGAGLGHRQKGEGRTGKQGNQAWHGSGKAS